MEIENCRMHGQVSRDSLYWVRSHLMEMRGPGRDWQGNKRPPDPTMCGQMCGSICLKHQKKELKRIMKMLVENWQIPMPAAMPCRLQLHQHRETCGTVTQRKTKCLYCWSWRIYEDTHGRASSQEPWRSYCRKRNEFIESLQSLCTYHPRRHLTNHIYFWWKLWIR